MYKTTAAVYEYAICEIHIETLTDAGGAREPGDVADEKRFHTAATGG